MRKLSAIRRSHDADAVLSRPEIRQMPYRDLASTPVSLQQVGTRPPGPRDMHRSRSLWGDIRSMTDVRTHRSVSGRLASILLAIVAAALALGAASPLFATTSSSPRPSSQTAAEATGEDTDNDGLTDHDEIRYHDTNPALADTDRDGILDGVEVNLYGTNPLRDDTDGDGMKDGAELRLGTDPRTPDTDRDGLVDGEELVFGTDPLNADTDGD